MGVMGGGCDNHVCHSQVIRCAGEKMLLPTMGEVGGKAQAGRGRAGGRHRSFPPPSSIVASHGEGLSHGGMMSGACSGRQGMDRSQHGGRWAGLNRPGQAHKRLLHVSLCSQKMLLLDGWGRKGGPTQVSLVPSQSLTIWRG